MTVFVKNLIINAGEDFTEDLEIFSADGSGVVDLTNFTAQSQLRKHPDSTKFVGIAVSITNPTQGKINISIADTITSGIKPVDTFMMFYSLDLVEINLLELRELHL